MRELLRGTTLAFILALVFVFTPAEPTWAQEGAGGDKKPPSRLKDKVGQESLILETDHFYIEAYESLGRTGLEAFGKKAEQAYSLACEVLDQPADKRLWADKCVVLMIRTVAHWHKYVDDTEPDEGRARVMKDASGTRTNEPGCVECLEKFGGSQKSLEQGALHQIGHHLLDCWSGKGAHPLPVWLDEGFASFIEFSVCGEVGSSCVGGSTDADLKQADGEWTDNWPAKLREAVSRGLGEDDADTFSWKSIRRCTSYNSMLRSQHAKSWSLVTFLVGRDKKQFQSFVKALKAAEKVKPETIQADAIDAAYESSFAELEGDWRKLIRQPPK
ncbi:MAG: hypothetical protein RDV41_09550 [Planctomycetota bacterium]|nr:hypothetical protein [Planctomycetota bacterium]